VSLHKTAPDLSGNGKTPILYHSRVYQSKSVISSCFLKRDMVVNITSNIFRRNSPISFQISFWKSTMAA